MKTSESLPDDQDLSTRKATSRKRNPHAAEEWELARAYLTRLVPAHAASAQRTTRDPYTGRRVYDPTWEHRWHACNAAEIRGALFYGDKLDVRGVSHVRYMVFDVDAHAAAASATRPGNLRGINDYMRASMGAAVAARRRAAVRDAAWDTCQAILERLPGAVPIQTRNGYHVVAFFETDVPAARAAMLASTIAREVVAPAGVAIECFPRPEGQGHAMCSLPLSGDARIVKPDGIKRMHRTRRSDVRWLLDGCPRIATPPAENKGGTKPAIAALGEAVMGRSGSASPEALADDGKGLPQTRGKAWRAQLSRVLGVGVGDDQSRWGVCKFVAGAFYLAIEFEIAARAFAAWLLLPGQTSTHASTAAGRRRLGALFRSQWKRYSRLADRGVVRVGKMRAPEVRRLYGDLAGALAMAA